MQTKIDKYFCFGLQQLSEKPSKDGQFFVLKHKPHNVTPLSFPLSLSQIQYYINAGVDANV